jgi:hypothetical protein
MAKARKSKSKKVKAVVRRKQPPLDALGLAYAKLLSDPCGAALTHPVYAGADSGFLVRADSVFSVGGDAGQTSGVLHWTPGYINSNNTELLFAAGTSGGTATVSSSGPGKSFLGANAAGARCIAACMKITYPGSESSRAGRLHYGHTVASIIDAGDPVTVDSVAPILQHYTRTPPEMVEVVWRPGVADMEFNDPNVSSNAQLRDRKSSITAVWAGLPAATGLTFHFTAVYEWIPRTTTGISTNTNGKSSSRNTLDDVVDAIQATGFTWVRNAAAHAATGAVAGLMSTISNTFGIMPSNQVNRNVRYTLR